MANTGEVLMSTRELGCRRTNQQAERYLSKVLGQLDVEKHLVERDWDHQMKTLILQKQKRMPKLWDNKNKLSGLRPRSAWGGRMHKNYVMTRPQYDFGSQFTPSPVPSHWHFLASYTATADGKRIPNTCPTSDPRHPAKKRDLQSARPTFRDMTGNHIIKPRRATSAPVRRSGLSTCIITQMPTFSEDLVEVQEQKHAEESNKDSHVMSSSRKKSVKTNVLSTGQNGLQTWRPQSAVTLNGHVPKMNGRLSRKKCASHLDLDRS